MEHGRFDALWRISKCKDPETEKLLISDIRRSLPRFVQQNTEYPSLLRFIADYLHAVEQADPVPGEQTQVYKKDNKNPTQVNNAVYTHLRMISSCSCCTQHLEYPRLRLDPEHHKPDDVDFPFDLLFEAGSTSLCTANCRPLWKEVKILVSRYGKFLKLWRQAKLANILIIICTQTE